MRTICNEGSFKETGKKQSKHLCFLPFTHYNNSDCFHL